jgi:hypothetical protein
MLWEGGDDVAFGYPADLVCPDCVAVRDGHPKPITEEAILEYALRFPEPDRAEEYLRLDGRPLLAAFAADGRTTDIAELELELQTIGGFISGPDGEPSQSWFRIGRDTLDGDFDVYVPTDQLRRRR